MQTHLAVYQELIDKPYKATKGQHATHNGMDDTRGRWFVPDYYQTSEAAREAFFDVLLKLHKRRLPYVLMENIKSLPDDRKTRLRFDIDANLPFKSSEDGLSQATVSAFVKSLWSVLHEHTNNAEESRFYIDRKLTPTA